MPPTRLDNAKPSIIDHLGSLPRHPLTYSQIREMLAGKRDEWRLARRTGLRDFIEYVLAQTSLEKVRLAFPNREHTRYVWAGTSVYALAMSLGEDCYFTHYTAMSMHDLTDQVPKTVYVNEEQDPKPRSSGRLEQQRIDAAFTRKPRVSNNVARYRDWRICLLNGKHTGRLGVQRTTGPAGEPVRVTCVERTLIDIAVRPFYSGGVYAVVEAYRRARPWVDVPRVAEMLRSLDYVYPYHQAIGFCMERAGVYDRRELELFRQFDLNFDFYLTFQMKDPRYVQGWRLYVPKGL